MLPIGPKGEELSGEAMATRGRKQPLDDGALRALLKRHGCPIAYHQVRAHLMGNIASPDLAASPMKEIRRIWGGELPVFEDQAEAEELFDGLLQGMWNGLGVHQKRNDPFRLLRVKTAPANFEYLGRLAKVRREELDGFVDGLFAGQEEMDFPESADKAVAILGELRALFAATEDLANNPPGPTDTSSLEATAKHLRELTRIAETEINTIIQSCRRARQQALETGAIERPERLN